MFRGVLSDDRWSPARLFFQLGGKGSWRHDLHWGIGHRRVLLGQAGQGDDNFCTHVLAAKERDFPLMMVNDDLGDCKPQTRAALGPAVRTVALGKFLEHRRLRRRLDTCAEIPDRDAQLIPHGVQRDQDLSAVV